MKYRRTGARLNINNTTGSRRHLLTLPAHRPGLTCFLQHSLLGETSVRRLNRDSSDQHHLHRLHHAICVNQGRRIPQLRRTAYPSHTIRNYRYIFRRPLTQQVSRPTKSLRLHGNPPVTAAPPPSKLGGEANVYLPNFCGVTRGSGVGVVMSTSR